MAYSPEYIGKPLTGHVSISTANTNRNGSGTIGDILTCITFANAGRGAKVARIRIAATGSTTAGSITIYRKVTGGTYYPLQTYLVPAITASATVRPFSLDQCTAPALSVDSDGSVAVDIALAPGEALAASTYNAETFIVSADYGEILS